MIDTSDCLVLDAIVELRRVVQRLALVSHAPAQTVNLAPPPDDLKRPARYRTKAHQPVVPHLGSHSTFAGDSAIPRGAVDFKGDKTPEYRQKSHVYFQRRLDGMVNAEREFGPAELSALVKEAEEALEAWQKTPMVEGMRPAINDPRWKEWVANCDHSLTELMRWYGGPKPYGVSRQYIHQIRTQYRREAA